MVGLSRMQQELRRGGVREVDEALLRVICGWWADVCELLHGLQGRWSGVGWPARGKDMGRCWYHVENVKRLVEGPMLQREYTGVWWGRDDLYDVVSMRRAVAALLVDLYEVSGRDGQNGRDGREGGEGEKNGQVRNAQGG